MRASLLLVLGLTLDNAVCSETHRVLTREELTAELSKLTAKVDKLSKGNRTLQGMTELDNGRLLVFRVTPEINTRAFDTYTARGHNDDDNPFVYTRPNCGCMSTENYRPCDRHYRSRFLDYWPSYLIDTVRLSVYEHGREMAYVEFNGRGSNYMNWFSRDRIISSSWTDLRTQPQNYFSIEGDVRPSLERQFFINRNYGGCPNDSGWLVVLDMPDPCSWGSNTDSPVILYSKRTTFVNWNTKADVGRADVLMITVKLRDDVDVNDHCYS